MSPPTASSDSGTPVVPSPSSNTRSRGTTTTVNSPTSKRLLERVAKKDRIATKNAAGALTPRQMAAASKAGTASTEADPATARSPAKAKVAVTAANNKEVHGPKSALEESVVRNSTPPPKEDDTKAGAVKDDTEAEAVLTEVASDDDEAKDKSANPTTPQVDKKLNLKHYAQSPVHDYMMDLTECYAYRDMTCAKMKREIHPTMIIALAIFYIDRDDNLTVCMPNANHNAFHKKTAGEILLGILSDTIPCHRLGSQSNELGNDMSALLTYDDGSEQVRSLL
jgi:hypothetical protein